MMYSLVRRCNVAVVCLALMARSISAQSTTQRVVNAGSGTPTYPIDAVRKFLNNDTRNAILSPFNATYNLTNNGQPPFGIANGSRPGGVPQPGATGNSMTFPPPPSMSGNGSSMPRPGSVPPGVSVPSKPPPPPPSMPANGSSQPKPSGMPSGGAAAFSTTPAPNTGSGIGASSFKPGASALPPGVPGSMSIAPASPNKPVMTQTTTQQTSPTSPSTVRPTTTPPTTRTTDRTTQRTTERPTERPTERTTTRATVMTTTYKSTSAPVTTNRPNSSPNKPSSKTKHSGQQGLFKEIIKNQTLIAELGQLYQTKGINAVAERLSKPFPAASKFLSSLKGKNTDQILLELMGDAEDNSTSSQPNKPMSEKEKKAAYEKIREGLSDLQSGLSDLAHSGDSNSGLKPTSGGNQQPSSTNKVSGGVPSSVKDKVSSAVSDPRSLNGASLKANPKRQYEEDMEEARQKNKKHKKSSGKNKKNKSKMSRQDYDSYTDDYNTDYDWWYNNYWGDDYWNDDSSYSDYNNYYNDYNDYYNNDYYNWDDSDWSNWNGDWYDYDYDYDYDWSRQSSRKEPQAALQIAH